MLSKEDFVRRILDGAPKVDKADSSPDSDEGMLAGFDAFDVTEDAKGESQDARFAQLLLEESGFGRGEILPRNEVILGDQKTNRFLPHGVTYWAKTADRPFHILLFDLELKGSDILSNGFFRRNDQLEDALHRIVQDALEGFERGGEGRTADRKQGAQTETLCVVSVIDDRRDGPARQLACFGTKCIETDSLEAFTLREEARDWDRPLAEEHLGQLFERHFKQLGTGSRWQNAFVSGEERKKARRLMAECARAQPDEKQLQTTIRDLLDEIAGSFGLRRKGGRGGHRLMMHALPEDHSIAVDPKDARQDGFKNPFQGLRIFDADERLIGYIVYVVDKKSEAERLRRQLAQYNHFHNVLVVYPEDSGATLELWQGNEPLRGRLVNGGRRSLFDGEGGVVQLLSRFFVVSRSAINTPRHLATELAWRAQHLKALALDELAKEEHKTDDQRPLRDLLEVFNQALATLDEPQFADAYAQTITYGLLAARWLSSERLDVRFTRKNIGELLPSTSPFLHDLFQRLVNSRFDQNLAWLLDDITSLLSRTMVAEVFQGEHDPSIHFYQDFLDAYDPQIRRERGVYYTPDEVVSYIVRTSHTALQERFGLKLGLADTTSWTEFANVQGISVPEGINGDEAFVQILDPAIGTGTFLLRVIEVIYETMMEVYEERGLDEKSAQSEWIKYVRSYLLPRINGFEVMMAPYIVSHLRLGLALQQTGFVFDESDRLRVFLTNTLEMHSSSQFALIGKHVAEEAIQAEYLKIDAPISVIIGNPPYERESARSDGTNSGGWMLSGWSEWSSGRPPMQDLFDGARASGAGGNIQTIYNLYVYFWRWAIWRLFERFEAPGILSFITASSFVHGPGFAGLRQLLRNNSDETYILDLGGDQKGSRVSENVFNILIGVSVGTVCRYRSRTPESLVSYTLVEGDRSAKLSFCGACQSLNDVSWKTASSDQFAPMLPAYGTAFTQWPIISDIFPVQFTGYHYYRSWPIAPVPEVLEQRWRALTTAKVPDRAQLLKETRDRKVHKSCLPLEAISDRLPPIAKLTGEDGVHRIERTGFRSFDRQWCIADTRVGDFIRPALWNTMGPQQIFLATMMAGVLGDGPAGTVSAHVPDCHYFCGRGGKDIIPLWLDSDASVPNIGAGAFSVFKNFWGEETLAQDVFAYAYAVLANPGYGDRFKDELQIPGPKLPLTKNKLLFQRGVELGRELLSSHTYGERMTDGTSVKGVASIITPIPSSVNEYPDRHFYDDAREVLLVGSGEIGPVSGAVWNFSVSGLQVIKSWLDYRMKNGSGRKSSPLDDIRPEQWTGEMTQELMELIWLIEWTLNKTPELDSWLEEVLQSELFIATEIPTPTDEERKEPKIQRSSSQGTLWSQ
ncbi:hypothetical protein C9993_02725 [Marinobacter sp. Z-F4-2]|nr:hypothetical protein C9993_02725 [Marinobacter sp. Z-F4-2]